MHETSTRALKCFTNKYATAAFIPPLSLLLPPPSFLALLSPPSTRCHRFLRHISQRKSSFSVISPQTIRSTNPPEKEKEKSDFQPPAGFVRTQLQQTVNHNQATPFPSCRLSAIVSSRSLFVLLIHPLLSR